ncbi:MAG TPA: nucleotidyl transferase AbiEii/AbiGii toxin family protein [Acidimicrobiales bacterium]|nr:nucleotidyl transferase AbiEii/AbiGii toxin family protein [Acidimicrobiales bacterium]
MVVAQMLADAAIKGGTGLNARLGPEASRFSGDLDASRLRGVSEDAYLKVLGAALKAGWAGFEGTAVRPPKRPLARVPDQYVMLPVKVVLSYRKSKFDTVRLELSLDEIGSVSGATAAINPSIVEMFTRVGLDAPQPIPAISLEHQIAQKIHACTTPNALGLNERAHDLVDLQLLYDAGTIDMAEMGRMCQRLTSFRRRGTWPPVLVAPGRWERRYDDAATGLPVLSLSDAVAWLNDLISAAETARINSAG